jgi:hypothetical protein
MDPQLRRALLDEYAPEIDRLGRLIERDLSAWHDGRAVQPAAQQNPQPTPA